MNVKKLALLVVASWVIIGCGAWVGVTAAEAWSVALVERDREYCAKVGSGEWDDFNKNFAHKCEK